MHCFIKYTLLPILLVACASSDIVPPKEKTKDTPQSEYRTELVPPTGVGYYVDFYGRINENVSSLISHPGILNIQISDYV